MRGHGVWWKAGQPGDGRESAVERSYHNTRAAADRAWLQDAVDLRVLGEIERGPANGGSESSKTASSGEMRTRGCGK